MQPEQHPVEIWWRIPCWCGWVGCWWDTDDKAWHSYYRHQAMAREQRRIRRLDE
jgi:hypothetical protein